MKGTYDEADYLSNAPRAVRWRPAWLRLGLPIVGIFVAAGGIAAAIGLTSEEIYEAEAEIELITPAGLGEDAALPLPAERIAAARTSAVATQAVVQLRLLDDPAFLTAHPSLDTAQTDPAQLRARAASILLANMDTGIDDGGSIASISYRSPDRFLATRIADGLALAFIPVDAQRMTGVANGSRAELEALVEQVKGELDAAERSLTEGMSEAEIVALPDAEADLLDVDGSDALSADARRALQSQLEQVRARLDEVEAAILSGELDTSDPVVTQLQERRAGLDAEYQAIVQQFREDYPAAQDLRERMDVIDASLQREAVRQAEDLSAEAQQLRIQESDIRAQLETLGFEVAERGTAGMGLGDVRQDVMEKRELYQLLLARLATADGEELSTTARIIQPAWLPTRPMLPDWRILIGSALAIALLLSILLVFHDRRRQRAAY
ncbi:hypothetical protein [Aurantiacibacter hainanensis]|uniref:hypothetical protein n=1 Tax=Aurantiacibacter hainanensis TaxID=3076114 RepID=UPI0030C73F88